MTVGLVIKTCEWKGSQWGAHGE